MPSEFLLPDVGEGLVDVQIIRWLVPVGGEVAQDQPLVEVETDKAVTDIPSPYAGTVLHHGASEGEALEVGRVLVVIGEPGETWPDKRDGSPATEGAGAAPIVGSLSEDAHELSPVAQGPGTETKERPPALPLVRKLAKELGVDLYTITGTGPDGRITRADVETAARSGAAEPTSTDRSRAGGPPPPSPNGDERRPLSPLRKRIAVNMSRSWAEIPHVTAFDEVDATRLLAVQTALQARHGQSIPIDALIVAAIVPALRAVPIFNATLDGDDLLVHGRYDIGIAVNTPDGLIVAVIRDAGSKGVLEIGAEVRRLGERARARALTVDEVTGQTFTMSNIGAVGGSYGTPIVPSGTVGILSVGRAKEQPVARAGKIEIAPVMPLSFSYDHRVTDGAIGRKFMALLIENLLEPALFLA